MTQPIRIEDERKFLVAPDTDWRTTAKPYAKHIVDRYLSCGRLRLRQMTDTDNGKVAYKLTKKPGAISAYHQPIETLYLSESEYQTFLPLDGVDLTKTRHYHHANGQVFGIDVFEDELSGLVICEAEADSLEQLKAIAFPPYAGIEVTENPFFTGGTLCKASAADLARELARAL